MRWYNTVTSTRSKLPPEQSPSWSSSWKVGPKGDGGIPASEQAWYQIALDLLPEMKKWITEDGMDAPMISNKFEEVTGLKISKGQVDRFIRKQQHNIDEATFITYLQNGSRRRSERANVKLQQEVYDMTGQAFDELGSKREDIVEHMRVKDLDPDLREVPLLPSETQSTVRLQPVRDRHNRNWIDKNDPLYMPDKSPSIEDKKWTNRNIN